MLKKQIKKFVKLFSKNITKVYTEKNLLQTSFFQ